MFSFPDCTIPALADDNPKGGAIAPLPGQSFGSAAPPARAVAPLSCPDSRSAAYKYIAVVTQQDGSLPEFGFDGYLDSLRSGTNAHYYPPQGLPWWGV